MQLRAAACSEVLAQMRGIARRPSGRCEQLPVPRERGEHRRRCPRRRCRRARRRGGCRPAREVTIPSAPSARDERRRVGRADADERAPLARLARRRDRAAELVDPRDQPLVQLAHVRAGLGDPDLLRSARSRRCPRRSPGSAACPTRSAARSARASSRGCPSRRCSGRRTSRVWVGSSALEQLAPGTRGSRGPAEASRYLSTPAPRKSTPSSPTSSGRLPIAW